MGVDWFRQYLVIEFAEEGLDLLTAIYEMLDRNRMKVEEEKHQDIVKRELEGDKGGGAEDGAKDEVEGGSDGGEDGAGVALDTERRGGREEAQAGGGCGAGDAGQGEEFDVRKSGKDLFERFIRSGCGAECNLPGTVVRKVRGW